MSTIVPETRTKVIAKTTTNVCFLGALLVAAFIAGVLLASCNPLATAWRSTAGVRSAATITDKAVANAHKLKRDTCDTAHGKGNLGYSDCITSSKQHEMLKAWHKYAKPTINASLTLTVTSLTLAENSKDKVDWLAMLKPAFCAIAKSVSQYGHMFPPSQQAQIKATLALVKGFTCD